jgi:hypothetical protein
MMARPGFDPGTPRFSEGPENRSRVLAGDVRVAADDREVGVPEVLRDESPVAWRSHVAAV